MDKERETLLFGHRDEKLNKALDTFGKTKNDVDQDMQIIKEWLETQKHFPENPRKYFTKIENNLPVLKWNLISPLEYFSRLYKDAPKISSTVVS